MALNNYPVNRSNFRLVKGIRNDIQFFIKDIDRKPVNMLYFTKATINIVDDASDTLLMSRDLVLADAPSGRYTLTVLASETTDWPTGPVKWSISVTESDGSVVALWTDMNYSPYSYLEVSAGPLPGPAPTTTLASSDLMLLTDGNYYSSSLPGSAQLGYNGGMHTFTVSMTNFAGSIRIDASLIQNPTDNNTSSDWFQVDLQTYMGKTGTVVLNEQGSYIWTRVVVIPAAGNVGTVDQVLYKN